MNSKEDRQKEYSQLALLSKSIGHPTRLYILKGLADRGGWAEGEIISVHGVSPSTVIQHLRELKRAGLIQGKIFGIQSKYGLNTNTLKEFHQIWNNTINNFLQGESNT